MPKQDKKKKLRFSFDNEILILFVGIASLVFLAYGAVNTFINAVDGLLWLIPLAFILWLAILWRLFHSRPQYGYILLGVMSVSLLAGLFYWRQDRLRAGKFIVLVAQFDMERENLGFRDQLIRQLREATNGFIDTEINDSNEIISNTDWNQAAFDIGVKESADLLVWGFNRQLVNPNVSIKIMDFSPKMATNAEKDEIYSQRETISSFDAIVVTRNIKSNTNTLSLFLAGLVGLKHGDYASSLKIFEQVLSQDDKTTSIPPYDLYFYIAYAQAGLRQTDLAIETYNKAILKYRKGPESYNNRGVIYANLGQDDLAVQNYTTAIQINKDYSAAYSNRGNAYVRMKQYDSAVLDFNVAVGIDPNYADGFYNRGNVFYTLGQYDSAVKDYSKVILIVPDSAPAYFNRGTAYLKLGKIAESDADFKKYIQILGTLP